MRGQRFLSGCLRCCPWGTLIKGDRQGWQAPGAVPGGGGTGGDNRDGKLGRLWASKGCASIGALAGGGGAHSPWLWVLSAGGMGGVLSGGGGGHCAVRGQAGVALPGCGCQDVLCWGAGALSGRAMQWQGRGLGGVTVLRSCLAALDLRGRHQAAIDTRAKALLGSRDPWGPSLCCRLQHGMACLETLSEKDVPLRMVGREGLWGGSWSWAGGSCLEVFGSEGVQTKGLAGVYVCVRVCTRMHMQLVPFSDAAGGVICQDCGGYCTHCMSQLSLGVLCMHTYTCIHTTTCMHAHRHIYMPKTCWALLAAMVWAALVHPSGP